MSAWVIRLHIVGDLRFDDVICSFQEYIWSEPPQNIILGLFKLLKAVVEEKMNQMISQSPCGICGNHLYFHYADFEIAAMLYNVWQIRTNNANRKTEASWTCELEFARYERRLFHLCVALSTTLKIEAHFNLLP